jgi:hypothetical protein
VADDDLSRAAVTAIHAVDTALLAMLTLACVCIGVRYILQRSRHQALELKYSVAVVGGLAVLGAWHALAHLEFSRVVDQIVQRHLDSSSLDDRRESQAQVEAAWVAVHDASLISYRGTAADIGQTGNGRVEVEAPVTIFYWVAGVAMTWAVLMLAAFPWRLPLGLPVALLIGSAAVIATASAGASWLGAQAYFKLSHAWHL